MPQRPRRAVLARSIVAALLLTLIGALPAGAAPPDRLIVFHSDRGGQVDLWTMRSDGSGLARLTNDKVPDNLAEWSPNRKQIAWTRGGEESPAGEIWVMNADGTGRRQVTSNTFSDNAVAWSPDGRQLAYRSTRDDNSGLNPNADNLGWFGWLGVVRVVVGASRWSPAGAADGCRLGGPDNHDRLDSRQRRLRPGPVLGALDAEAGHLALDHPREGPQPPDGQQLLGHLAGHPGQGPGRWLRGERPPGRWW
jgi:dipeptidyl aminopeptidase/acylaminoacyl peptidase